MQLAKAARKFLANGVKGSGTVISPSVCHKMA